MAQWSALTGIVLAAGQSSRMGQPKALLRMPDEETFVGQVIRTLREGGVSDVLVVGRPEDGVLKAHVAGIMPPTSYVENPAPGRGQLSSMLAGIDHAQALGAHAVMVMPVDIPLVRPRTVAQILSAFSAGTAPIVRATHGGRHGHPVIFGEAVFADLRSADPREGAKAVLRAHAARILNVEVDDPGVLADVDVPEDYARLFGDRR